MGAYGSQGQRAAQPFQMVVELGKAREFARAVDHPDPIEPCGPVPITFLQSMAFWAGPECSVWPPHRDLSRTLHGQQEFVFHGGPIRVGEELTGLRRVDKTWTKEGKRGGVMDFTQVITDFRDRGGALRAEVRTVTIETGEPSA
ncbi:MaoC family dehydratase N-terminal domain-containing protein [Sporichthya sp.]|uniref:FAS1-like dehydratase domain-containing protein n=1 Tax=Sporichthya sp. TaxID=65475 RepID=UPI0017D0F6ED|nr:MaoC family dehydratase N-terminal domain-containing protein [Sporichthya sp.]MBA3741390.1 MaoC family dehydratase N-terminal domain-containing protein [Sporichthya sp.]